MKIYILSKITGKDRESISKAHEKMEIEILKKGHEPVNPSKYITEHMSSEEIFKVCLEKIISCDSVYVSTSSYRCSTSIRLNRIADISKKSRFK